ncbi:hypothetical protein HNQ50_004328 [Silvimonas terrae]|uniref:Toxin CptA n=1 Tax=Silvimonas terrae TaxID=300266 RepID=A0A840RM50_9NEIS|nr:protein YgfX [Silvimonas terrae]MBB5193570.1 hypothetical protein [Silvimonas terrae]
MAAPGLNVEVYWQAGRTTPCLLAFAGALALVCAALLPWPWFMPGMAVVLTGLAWTIYTLRQQATHGLLRLGPENQLRVQWGTGPQERAQVQASSLVCAHLIVLHLRVGERRRWRALVLWPDSMSGADFRQLCAALRWGAGSQPNKTSTRAASSGSGSTRAGMS